MWRRRTGDKGSIAVKYGMIENKNGNQADFASVGFPFPFIYYCDLTSFQSAL